MRPEQTGELRKKSASKKRRGTGAKQQTAATLELAAKKRVSSLTAVAALTSLKKKKLSSSRNAREQLEKLSSGISTANNKEEQHYQLSFAKQFLQSQNNPFKPGSTASAEKSPLAKKRKTSRKKS